MTDKILCPWCGAEMSDGWHENGLGRFGNYLCQECFAKSPDVAWPIGLPKEQFDMLNKAAALRRYTPPIKPMTRQELPRRYLMPCWIEQKGEDVLPDLLDKDSTGFYGKFENLNARETNYLFYAEYGKTWRCWERKPTDEERSAAEWETSRQE